MPKSRSNWGLNLSIGVRKSDANVVIVGEQLAKMMHTCCFYDDLKPSKVGHSDLFTLSNRRSVCARLQVSACSDYNLCHPGFVPPWLTSRHTHRNAQIAFDQLI